MEASQSSSKMGSSSDSEVSRGILVERRARLVERDRSVAGCESGGVINRICIIPISTSPSQANKKTKERQFEHERQYTASNEIWA